MNEKTKESPLLRGIFPKLREVAFLETFVMEGDLLFIVSRQEHNQGRGKKRNNEKFKAVWSRK